MTSFLNDTIVEIELIKEYWAARKYLKLFPSERVCLLKRIRSGTSGEVSEKKTLAGMCSIICCESKV
jgi:hypothetical protein